jgi:hypothetical protein
MWHPMDTAPVDRDIIVWTKAGSVVKVFRDEVGEDENGETAFGWIAREEGEHPPSWDDGICWASNMDGDTSDPPILWTELPE